MAAKVNENKHKNSIGNVKADENEPSYFRVRRSVWPDGQSAWKNSWVEMKRIHRWPWKMTTDVNEYKLKDNASNWLTSKRTKTSRLTSRSDTPSDL